MDEDQWLLLGRNQIVGDLEIKIRVCNFIKLSLIMLKFTISSNNLFIVMIDPSAVSVS